LATELHERLNEVNRTFTSIAIVTGFPDFWAQSFPKATIVADDDLLKLEPGAHDLVLHVMALHWANDPVGQLVQCRHALKPDGLLLCGFLGGQTLHELRASLAEAEAIVAGGISPRIAPMGETNAMIDRVKHMTRRNVMTETASIYAEHFTNDDGRVDATFELITLTGWAPGDGQQQPLRPGSAKIRLADALGATETPIDPSQT
jgi:SAM-dependent methyltransferase